MGASLGALGQDRAEREAVGGAADAHHGGRDQVVPRAGAGGANRRAPCAGGRSATQAGREGSKAVSRWLLSFALLGAAGCATPARPQIMDEVDRTREGKAVVDA